MSPSTIDKMFEIYTFFENTTEIHTFFENGTEIYTFFKNRFEIYTCILFKKRTKISNILSIMVDDGLLIQIDILPRFPHSCYRHLRPLPCCFLLGEQVFLKSVSKLNSIITNNFGETEEVEKLYARSKSIQP